MPIKDMPVTNKQHAVPQNIMDVEFKLIGDLTMRQFAYLFIFGAIAWGAFLSVRGIFKWPIIIIAVLLGIGLAFVPLEDRGLDQWIINFFKSIYSPTQKVWRKDPQVPLAFTYQNLAVLKQELITLAPTSSRRKLEEYLEYQGKENLNLDKYDLAEQEYINKVKEAFGDTTSVEAPTQVIEAELYQDTSPAPALPPLQPLPPVAPEPLPEEPKQEIPVEKTPIPLQPSPAPVPVESVTPVLPPTPLPPVQSIPVASPPSEVPPVPVTVQVTQPKPVPPVPKPVPAPAPALKIQPAHKIRMRSEVPLTPLTPDRHSGRRFVSLLPKQGQIVLPIRGEKVLKTSEEMSIESDIQEKTEQLTKLISQIKDSEGFNKRKPQPRPEVIETSPQVPSPAPQPAAPVQPPQNSSEPVSGPKIEITPPVVGHKTEINAETQNVIENVKAENARLEQEIDNLRKDMNRNQQTDEERQQKKEILARLEMEKSKAKDYYDALQSKVQELQSTISQKEKIETPTTSAPIAKSNLPPATRPNIISGIVRDPDGAAIDGAVVIIKDSNNDPKRAIKTNILGQFSLATPLSDGDYLVEVTKSDKMYYSFGIIPVVAKGEPIPPIEFIGKR